MLTNNNEYYNWLQSIKQQIRNGQIKAALAVNSQLILLYWDLGRQIVEKQQNAKWGSGFIEQLSKDLKVAFPDMGGFSVTNLQYCRRFYLFYSQNSKDENLILPQVGAELQSTDNEEYEISPQVGEEFKIGLIPWGHHKLIIDKCKHALQAVFYINKTIENNWSRSVLEYQIETKLYERQGKGVSNFSKTMPEAQSDLANALLKDPYNFEFLALSEKIKETDLEKSLVKHITQFLLELGKGFAYMGKQYKLKVGNKERRTDLLFYHTK